MIFPRVALDASLRTSRSHCQDPTGRKAARAAVYGTDGTCPGRTILGASGILLSPLALPGLYSAVTDRLRARGVPLNALEGAFVLCLAASVTPFLAVPSDFALSRAADRRTKSGDTAEDVPVDSPAHFSLVADSLFPTLLTGTLVDVLGDVAPIPTVASHAADEAAHVSPDTPSPSGARARSILEPVLDWQAALVVVVGAVPAAAGGIAALTGGQGCWGLGWPVAGLLPFRDPFRLSTAGASPLSASRAPSSLQGVAEVRNSERRPEKMLYLRDSHH